MATNNNRVNYLMPSIDSMFIKVSNSLSQNIESILPPAMQTESQSFFEEFRAKISNQTNSDFLSSLTKQNDSDDEDDDIIDLENLDKSKMKLMNCIKQTLENMDTGKDAINQIKKITQILTNAFNEVQQSLTHKSISLDTAFVRFCILIKFISIYIDEIHKFNSENNLSCVSYIPDEITENLHNAMSNGMYDQMIVHMLMTNDKENHQILANMNTFNRMNGQIHSALQQSMKITVPKEILCIISEYLVFYWHDFMMLCMRMFAVILDKHKRKSIENALLYETLWYNRYHSVHNVATSLATYQTSTDFKCCHGMRLFSNYFDDFSYIIPLKCIKKMSKKKDKKSKMLMIKYIKNMILTIHIRNDDYQGMLAFVWTHCYSKKAWNEFMDVVNYSNCAHKIFECFFVFKRGYFDNDNYKTLGVLFTKIMYPRCDEPEMPVQHMSDSIFEVILPVIDACNECLFGVLFCFCACKQIKSVEKFLHLYGDTLLFLVDNDCTTEYFPIVLNRLCKIRNESAEIEEFYCNFKRAVCKNDAELNKKRKPDDALDTRLTPPMKKTRYF